MGSISFSFHSKESAFLVFLEQTIGISNVAHKLQFLKRIKPGVFVFFPKVLWNYLWKIEFVWIHTRVLKTTCSLKFLFFQLCSIWHYIICRLLISIIKFDMKPFSDQFLSCSRDPDPEQRDGAMPYKVFLVVMACRFQSLIHSHVRTGLGPSVVEQTVTYLSFLFHWMFVLCSVEMDFRFAQPRLVLAWLVGVYLFYAQCIPARKVNETRNS